MTGITDRFASGIYHYRVIFVRNLCYSFFSLGITHRTGVGGNTVLGTGRFLGYNCGFVTIELGSYVGLHLKMTGRTLFENVSAVLTVGNNRLCNGPLDRKSVV